MLRRLALVVAWLALLSGSGNLGVATPPISRSSAGEGSELLGVTAPEWEVVGWRNSPPLRLAELRGRAVLVRWWTGPECPFCRASAPALRELHQAYGPRGLVVVGLYHHKSPTSLDPERVAALAAELGFDFPVAIDPDWRTLRRWWLDGAERGFTSASFLLDREGAVRWIHPGGTLAVDDADWKRLIATLEGIL